MVTLSVTQDCNHETTLYSEIKLSPAKMVRSKCGDKEKGVD